MNTRIISINPSAFLDEELSLAGKTIASGGLVAFPTETVYGLGASALSGDACDRVFFAKGRPHDNPLIVHVLDPDDCQKYATIHEKSLFYMLADRFMPGPLTIVLPKKDIIPNSVTVGLSTVALRCPSHPIARALIRVSKVPIAAPSANLSGKPSPTVAEHVISDMNGRIDMILDGGPCQVGLESTVIALKGDAIHLLRPGYVTAEDLLSVTDNVVVSPAVLASLAPGDNPESPGMKYRHYAPSSPVTMVEGKEEDVLGFFKQKLQEGCGILCFEEDLPFLCPESYSERVISFGSRNDLLSQAKHLFEALRCFDSIHVPRIYARFTARDHLGLAISNRLLRACAFDLIKL